MQENENPPVKTSKPEFINKKKNNNLNSNLGPKVNIQKTTKRAGNWLSDGRSRTGEITGEQERLEGAVASLLTPAGC